MTNRIDIEVTDGVSPEVKTKLEDIAVAAEKSHYAVEKLRNALRTLDAQPFVQLAKAQTMLQSASEKSALAYLKQETALNRAVEAEAKAKLATDRLAASQIRQAAAASRALTEQERLNREIAKARADQFAKNAQQDFNKLLGVDRGVTKSAQESAAAFLAAANSSSKFGKQVGLNRQQVLTLQFTLNDIAASLASGASPFTILMQQGGQVTQAFGGIRGTFTTLLGVLNPVYAAVALVAGGIAALVGITAAADREIAKINNTLQSVGGYAGVTASDFFTLADSVAEAAKISKSQARDLALDLAATGQFQREQIEQNAFSISKIAKITGETSEKVADRFKRMADGPAAFAKEFNRQFHILNATQLDYIRQLEETGQRSKAVAELSKMLYEQLGSQAPVNLGYLQKAWNAVGRAISDAWTALKDFGREQTTAEKILSVQARLAAAQAALDKPRGASTREQRQSRVDAIQRELDGLLALQKAERDAAKEAADLAKIQQEGSEASERLSNKWLDFGDNISRANREIDAFKRDLAAALKADPTNPAALQAQARQAQIITEIRKRFAPQQFKDAESRVSILQKVNAELQKELDHLGKVQDEREVLQRLDQIDIDLQSKKLAKMTPEERSGIEKKLRELQEGKRLQAAQDRILEDALGPLRDYNLALQASSNLRKAGAISADQEAEAVLRAREAYTAAVDPLAGINRDLQQQLDLYKKFGPERAIAAQMQQIENQLRAKGKTLTEEQSKAIEDQLRQLQKLNVISQEFEAIVNETVGAQQQIAYAVEAAKLAYDSGAISLENYLQKLTQLGIQSAELKLKLGDASFLDALDVGLASLIKNYEGLLPSLSQAFGGLFQGIADGAASSIGQALIMGESLGDSLKKVAQDALSTLVSALIKIGIQYVINQALGDTFAKKAAANTIAQTSAEIAAIEAKAAAGLAALTATTVANNAAAAATAAAWAPAAAMASLASFGGNSGPAMAGITATVGLAEALSALPGFKLGGYTGDGGLSDPAGVVHGREFVVNAEGTARNRPLLERMNRGESVGTDGATAVVVAPKVIVNTLPGETASVRTRDTNNGPEIEITIERTVARSIREGGMVSDAIEQTYGSNRAVGAAF